jgi:quercetin dioxygenase-like cupin family protein
LLLKRLCPGRPSFPNSGYVLSGRLTIQDRESGKSKTIHAGEAFAEAVNDVHRGVSRETPTVVILTYAPVAGTPTSIAVKGGRPEY